MTTHRQQASADDGPGDADTLDDSSASGPTMLQEPLPALQGVTEIVKVVAGHPEDGPLLGAVLDIVHDLDQQVTHLKVALQTNRRIGIAVGIVMSQLRVGDEEAFAALRQVSQNRNRKLRDVAEDVIYAGHLEVDA